MNTIKFLLLSFLSLSNVSFAMPEIKPFPEFVENQNVFVSIDREDHTDTLYVRTTEFNSYYGEYNVHILINGELVAEEPIYTQDRGMGSKAYIELPINLSGLLEIYFVNFKGEYISDYGRNFKFYL